MHQLISRMFNWFLRRLLKQTILILTLLFCIALGIALSSMSHLSSHLIESQAVQNAALSAKNMKQAISLYSDQAVSRAKKVKGITVIHNYPTVEGAIPLPSTLLIELGQEISKNNIGMSARVYSDYPFPWRRDTGGIKTDFEREALSRLRANPNKPFFRQETIQSHTSLHYAESIIMEASCVACHNTHLNSPKKDWAVGDVRGVLEIVQPLDRFIEETHKRLAGTFVMLGGIGTLGLSGLVLVMGRLRQTARELEGRVRERTADLAIANTDLEKKNGLLRQVFGRYLTEEVVAALLENPERLKLGGERRKITILVSDLRGFTAAAERLQPEEVIEILNLYLKYMTDIITQYQGTIDKFMGDGILVLFGAPTQRQDDAARAVACACAMQLAMNAINAEMQELGWPRLGMGIGINTGIVVVGNIGSDQHTDYSVVGSQVNLAYRIETYTASGQVLISEQTFQEVRSKVSIGGHKQVHPKGVKHPITIYEVLGIEGESYQLFLPQETEVFFAIPEPILIQYRIVDDKDVGNTIFSGFLVQLSPKGALVSCNLVNSNQGEIHSLPSALTNLKLNLLTQEDAAEVSDDIYAKVTEKPAEAGSFYIHFTAVSPPVQAKLEQIYGRLS